MDEKEGETVYITKNGIMSRSYTMSFYDRFSVKGMIYIYVRSLLSRLRHILHEQILYIYINQTRKSGLKYRGRKIT